VISHKIHVPAMMKASLSLVHFTGGSHAVSPGSFGPHVRSFFLINHLQSFVIMPRTLTPEQNRNASKSIPYPLYSYFRDPNPHMSIRTTVRILVKDWFMKQGYRANTADRCSVVIPYLVGQVPPQSRPQSFFQAVTAASVCSEPGLLRSASADRFHPPIASGAEFR
jgi:hypothetical protein